MSELGMRKVQILSWLLQNVKLGRRVQRDQQRFDRRQELHLREFIAIKGGGRPARLLPHAKMLLVPINVSFCWVDYAMESSTFLLSSVILAACFTLRGHVMAHTVLMCFCFWSVGFALWCKSIFFDLFWSIKLFIAVLLFSKVPSGSEEN